MFPFNFQLLGHNSGFSCHVFSGYENQTNIALKWSRVVGEEYEKNPS